jgi:hypothetical protein
MRSLSLLLAVAALAVPTMVLAAAVDTASGTVGVDGSVAARCQFTLASATITIPEMSDTTSGATAGQLDPAKVNGQHASLTGWCNGSASTMQVQAFPILSTDVTGAPPTGFTNRVDYRATATAHPTADSNVPAFADSTSANPGASVAVGVFSSDIDVTLSAASATNGAKLVAGAYQGSVDVTLTPLT